MRAFIRDESRVPELEDRYRLGDALGDGHVKAEVATTINELLGPMRERRAALDGPGGQGKNHGRAPRQADEVRLP